MRRSPPRQSPPSECPLEEGLDVLSSRWVPQILWYLSQGPRRFGDLKRDLGPPISSKVLTARLRELECAGIVIRELKQTRPPTAEYRMSADGQAFVPVLDALKNASAKLRKRKTAAES